MDTGDFVVVINAEKIRLTGKKEEQKTYMSYSGFIGGHKTENVKARRERHPELIVERPSLEDVYLRMIGAAQ